MRMRGLSSKMVDESAMYSNKGSGSRHRTFASLVGQSRIFVRVGEIDSTVPFAFLLLGSNVLRVCARSLILLAFLLW
jgi:hypothetical protein